jgi:hypothetical protein
MSRFFYRGGSDSESSSSDEEEDVYERSEEEEESDEESSDQSDSGSEESDSDDEATAKGGAAAFLKDDSESEEEEEEEKVTVVKSAKDKRLEGLENTIKLIENAEKINDWSVISTGEWCPLEFFFQVACRISTESYDGAAGKMKILREPTGYEANVGCERIGTNHATLQSSTT